MVLTLKQVLEQARVDDFPFEGKIVEVDSNMSNDRAFRVLVENRLSSVPVFDKESHKYLGELPFETCSG